MICKKCQDSGQRSIVRILGTKKGDIPKDFFFDEEGVEHSHDPNVVTTQFRCSNGHRFQEISSWQCHCGYKACEAAVTFIGEAAEQA
jgi:hypothetical protein